MAAHSSCRAVARAVSDVGVVVWSKVGVLIHPTGVLWDSGQDSGLASPFLERYCPQNMLYGREHRHADTIIITELVFYSRQHATGQNVLVSFRFYISVQYYKRAKSIP
jgi:hypothetical protein